MKDKLREQFLKDKRKNEPFIYWVLRKKIESYKAGKCSMKEIEMQINWIETINWHVRNNKPLHDNTNIRRLKEKCLEEEDQRKW